MVSIYEFVMRKLIFSALLVLSFAFQGEAKAIQLDNFPNPTLTSNEDQKVYNVLEAAAVELGMGMQSLVDKFEQGDATVEKVDSTTYRVTVSDSGSMTGVLIEDQF